jgi:ribonucleoside-diphosphate reductase alpha chain
VIDNNYYPTPETKASNLALRPIGIGIHGLGDLYHLAGLDYDSTAAAQLDAEVMETIYHGAMSSTVDLAKAYGPYPRFHGSLFSKGIVQLDLYAGVDSSARRWDWKRCAQTSCVSVHATAC